MASLTGSWLADQVGMTPDALRYYERTGLLTKPELTASGYRLYDEETADRLRFIKGAQRLGLRLREPTCRRGRRARSPRGRRGVGRRWRRRAHLQGFCQAQRSGITAASPGFETQMSEYSPSSQSSIATHLPVPHTCGSDCEEAEPLGTGPLRVPLRNGVEAEPIDTLEAGESALRGLPSPPRFDGCISTRVAPSSPRGRLARRVRAIPAADPSLRALACRRVVELSSARR
jgi:hypothetical protein